MAPIDRIRLAAPLALWSLAGLAAIAVAQGGGPNGQGRIREERDVQVCSTAGGGSRTKDNCNLESTTVRTEQELTISIELPAPPSAQCEATVSTDYHQRNTAVRVASTIEVAGCTAAAGEFTLAVRIKDDNGPREPLEFKQPWQRADDADVSITADYPIGENVELVSVRARDLRCTCAAAPQPAE